MAPRVLAVVSFTAHFEVLLQFLLSYAARVTDPAACSLLVLVSTGAEERALSRLVRGEPEALAPVLGRLTIVDLPSAVRLLSPNTTTPLPLAKNRGPLGRLYVCTKKAYAARYAHEVLGAQHAIVTDSEAYVWKPLSMGGLFERLEARPAVWYADAPLHAARAAKAARPRPAGGRAPIDINWCSLHVFGDARGLLRSELAARVPAPNAMLFENMLFSYPRDAFRGYWRDVEAAWGGRPWFDALAAAHAAEPRCVAVGFWMEVSWHLYLYGRHRPRYAFRNVTASIERSFGAQFVAKGAYVHARLELLWRALSNATMGAFRRFYAETGLPFFRYEYRSRALGCLPLRLVADVPPPAASFQANSAVPNWAFGGACAAELERLKRLSHGARLPWVAHRTAT